MTSLSIGPVRRWRRFAGLFAILLALASVIPTYALPAVGVINGGFGAPPSCNLTGWTTTGNGYAITRQDSIYERQSCVAVLTATTGLDEASAGDKNVFAGRSATTISPQYKYATIEQRFLVTTRYTTKPVLDFFIEPQSSNPNSMYMAQSITLYNSAGQLIYEKSRNTQDESEGYPFYRFQYDLTTYANQYVTVRITVQIDSAVSSSPTTARMKIDFDCPYLNTVLCGDGNPGSAPPGSW